MKTKRLRLTILVMLAFLITGCSDDNEVLVLPVENKMLAVADTVCMMFKSMNGSSEGGIEGVEMSKYRERHLRSMNGFMFSFDKFVEESSITFIGETDSVKINGYVSCGYTDYPFNASYYVISANDKAFKYKFEDNVLKILYDPAENYWIILGYGSKEKIEVYIETKNFYVGAMPIDPNDVNPPLEDKYVWEIQGNYGIDVNISIDPKQASTIVQRQDWQDFFDEVNVEWINIPIGKYYSETFKSSQDMKHKYQGATWSVYKMTYLPKIAEN